MEIFSQYNKLHFIEDALLESVREISEDYIYDTIGNIHYFFIQDNNCINNHITIMNSNTNDIDCDTL